jgi:hypothetical protein
MRLCLQGSVAFVASRRQWYKLHMTNTFDIETARQIELLAKEVGGLDECKRLGFIFEDKQGIMSLSVTGFGYFLYVRTGAATTLAEAFAAGYQCAHDEKSKARSL